MDENERTCLAALVDCLIPADAFGPSASEAGVVSFIDRQLAGSYGDGSRTFAGVRVHASQTDEKPPLPLSLLYNEGIAALDRLSLRRNGSLFASASPDDCQSLLLEIDGGHSGDALLERFFRQALENTIEGYYSDPIHGGNRDAISWKMLGFPGCGHDYRAFVGNNVDVAKAVPLQTIEMLKKKRA